MNKFLFFLAFALLLSVDAFAQYKEERGESINQYFIDPSECPHYERKLDGFIYKNGVKLENIGQHLGVAASCETGQVKGQTKVIPAKFKPGIDRRTDEQKKSHSKNKSSK